MTYGQWRGNAGKWAAEERVTRKGDTEGRTTRRGDGGTVGETRVADRECIGKRRMEKQCGVEGSCSKPRPVRLADFMTMAET